MWNSLGMFDFLLFVAVISLVLGDDLGMFNFLLVVTVGWLMVWWVFGWGGLVMGLFSMLGACMYCLVWQYWWPWCSMM